MTRTTAGGAGGRRKAGRAGGAALLAAVLLGGAGPALAHARLLATEPAPGAVVAARLEWIVLTFDAPTRLTMLRLTSAGGKEIGTKATAASRFRTRHEAVPEALPDGRYTVRWRGLSADGHVMKGTFAFEVAR